MYFALNRAIHGLYFDILDPYKRAILFLGLYFGKMWKFFEKRPFFRADMAGLGKYSTGGYGRIGVYRVNKVRKESSSILQDNKEGLMVLSALSRVCPRQAQMISSRIILLLQ